MVRFWSKSSPTFLYTININSIVVLIFYQVAQVTLCLELDKFIFVASIWYKSSNIFQNTIDICFIVVLILYQVIQVIPWLEVSKATFVASFWYKSSIFHSACNSVQRAQWLIWFETYLIVVLILFRSKVRFVCIYNFHKKWNIFTAKVVRLLWNNINMWNNIKNTRIILILVLVFGVYELKICSRDTEGILLTW